MKWCHLHKLKVIRFSSTVVMDYRCRAVASYLAYRAANGQGASAKEIGLQLRIARTKTVPKAIKELIRLGFVKKRNKKYHVVLPEASYLPRRNNWESDWTKRYGFWFVRIPKKNVTLLQSMVLGIVESRAKRDSSLSFGYLAKCLGITKYQARYNYERLVALNLVVTVRRKGGSFLAKPVALDETTKMFFRQKPVKPEVVTPMQDFTYKMGTRQQKWYDRFTRGQHCFTSNQAHQLIAWMEMDSGLYVALDKLEDVARRDHAANVESGKVVADKRDYFRLYWNLITQLMNNKFGWSDVQKEHYKKLR